MFFEVTRATQPLHSQGYLNKGDEITSSYLTSAFSTDLKRAESLRNPCILGGPEIKGEKSRTGCLTHAFWGAHKWAEVQHNPYILRVPNKGNEIKIGCLTCAFSGAQEWAKMLCNPCILRGPQTKGDKTRIGCLLGGAKEGGIATYCVLSGPQTNGNKVRSGCLALPFSRAFNQHAGGGGCLLWAVPYVSTTLYRVLQRWCWMVAQLGVVPPPGALFVGVAPTGVRAPLIVPKKCLNGGRGPKAPARWESRQAARLETVAWGGNSSREERTGATPSPYESTQSRGSRRGPGLGDQLAGGPRGLPNNHTVDLPPTRGSFGRAVCGAP